MIQCCCACGTSFPDAQSPPKSCPVCEDERQFIPPSGQSWILVDQLAKEHRNAWRQHEADLLSVETVPTFAIGQRAILLRIPSGNILWDCITLLDDATKTILHGLGGIAAIAISHPHFYTTMQDWATEFNAPIYLHADDKEWVQRPSQWLRFWEGPSLELNAQTNLIRAGGHFPGSSVLHWTGAGDGKGVLLAGDTVQVTPGATHVSFMWSYPNRLPLSVEEVKLVAERIAPWSFERIYGAFAGQEVRMGGDQVVAHSAEEYLGRLRSGGVDVSRT
ncbi:MBL fold metallo-hydrolase [Rhizobium herbae]